MLEILEVMREVELRTGDGVYMYMVGNRGFSLSRQGDKGTVEQWDNKTMGQWIAPEQSPHGKTKPKVNERKQTLPANPAPKDRTPPE